MKSTQNDYVYAAEYVRQALNTDSIERPDTTRLNGYAEPLEALYMAHHKGGLEAAQRAWGKIVELRPELADLLRPPTPSKSGRRILHASQLKNLPPMEWLIEGMLPARSLCEIHGAPGAGKSLLALDVAATVAKNKTVLYLAAEGVSGYANRIEAWQTAHKAIVGNLHFDIDPFSLLEPQDVQDFIDAARPLSPALIVIDTLARCMVGGDENSARDMGLSINACDIIRQALSATVLLIHHTGKSGANERGSSALRGGCDSMIELTNEDGTVRVSSSKLKDGKPFDTYKLRMVEFGASVALVSPNQVVEQGPVKLPPNRRKVLEMLALSIFRQTGAVNSRIKENTGLSGGTLDRVLSDLKQAGYVTLSKRGEPYIITAAGVKVISE